MCLHSFIVTTVPQPSAYSTKGHSCEGTILRLSTYPAASCFQLFPELLLIDVNDFVRVDQLLGGLFMEAVCFTSGLFFCIHRRWLTNTHCCNLIGLKCHSNRNRYCPPSIVFGILQSFVETDFSPFNFTTSMPSMGTRWNSICSFTSSGKELTCPLHHDLATSYKVVV